MDVTRDEIKLLCGWLETNPDELLDAAYAFRKHIEPKNAVTYVADYMGSIMLHQTEGEQNKMLQGVISRCTYMLTN